MTTLIRKTLALALLLTCAVVFTAQAQLIAEATPTDPAETETISNPVTAVSSLPAVSEAWMTNVDQQFADALESPIETVREQALRDVIYLATFQADKVTFKRVISPLVSTYRLDRNEAHQFMALSALAAIGDGYGIERLREEVGSVPSDRLRRATAAVLAQYDQKAN